MSILVRRLGTSRRCAMRSCAAGATFLLLTSSTQAGTVLQFAQVNAADTVTATDTAGVTTLSTAGNADALSSLFPSRCQILMVLPSRPVSRFSRLSLG